jgi:hypothetical protein
MDDDTHMYLSALHSVGVLIAILASPSRWAGICSDSIGRYWLCEGDVTSAEDIRSNGLKSVDHFYVDDYDEALAIFRHWWDGGFSGVPKRPSR